MPKSRIDKFLEEFDKGEVVGEIEISDEDKRLGCFAVQVSGDSMYPELRDKEIVLFKPVNGDAPREGAICAVEVTGWEQWVVKSVYRDPRGRVVLRSFNPSFPPMEINPEVESITIHGTIHRAIRNYSKVAEASGPYGVTRK